MTGDRLYTGMVMDSHGKIWISTMTHGIFYFDGSTFNPVKIGPGFKSADVELADTKGNLWFVSDNNLMKYDGKKWITFNGTQTGIKKDIIAVAEAPSGKIYVGTADGLFAFDRTHWEKIALPGGDIYQYTIRAIAFGKDNQIAVGHNSGLLLFDGKTWTNLNTNNTKMPLDVVTAVNYAPSGELYVGYGGGLGNGGFLVVEGSTWKNYDRHNSKLPDQYVRAVAFAPTGTIWLGTNNGVLKITAGTWTPLKFTQQRFETIFGIITDAHATWIMTSHGLVKYTE